MTLSLTFGSWSPRYLSVVKWSTSPPNLKTSSARFVVPRDLGDQSISDTYIPIPRILYVIVKNHWKVNVFCWCWPVSFWHLRLNSYQVSRDELLNQIWGNLRTLLYRDGDVESNCPFHVRRCITIRWRSWTWFAYSLNIFYGPPMTINGLLQMGLFYNGGYNILQSN